MGWFWADSPVPTAALHALPESHPHGASGTPPAGCPMHKRTLDALTPPSAKKAAPPSSCPISHSEEPSASATAKPSLLSSLNPLNYMFKDISQAPAANQSQTLPTDREASTIPKGSRDGNWEYPSPQQMYNALLRKGYTDTDVTAVESMVAVHNFLNEGAWNEIVEWERRFGRGLSRGWQISKQGEENAELATRRLEVGEGSTAEPTLLRFQGRPKDMTPKAAMIQMLGKAWPSKFGTEPPFDRHDWYVSRTVNGEEKQVRYVIDYYTGPPEPTGEPVFFLDVRPAITPIAAVERLMRWGGDIWWRASGAEARDPNQPLLRPSSFFQETK